MSYQANSDVLIACSSNTHLDTIKHFGVVPMPDGYIAGLNGLLLGVAASRGIDAACLLATIPSYAANMPYPKASLEIVKVFKKIFSLNLELAELTTSVSDMNQQLAAIEERIKQLFRRKRKLTRRCRGLMRKRSPTTSWKKSKAVQKAEQDRSAAQELKKNLTNGTFSSCMKTLSRLYRRQWRQEVTAGPLFFPTKVRRPFKSIHDAIAAPRYFHGKKSGTRLRHTIPAWKERKMPCPCGNIVSDVNCHAP